MAVGLAVGRANAFLDSELATVYVQLHTGDPGAAGTANAATGDASRKAVTHASASGGSAAISGTNPSWSNAGASETITHLSYWSASSGGTFKGSSQLQNSRAWASGDTLTLVVDTWALTPIAS